MEITKWDNAFPGGWYASDKGKYVKWCDCKRLLSVEAKRREASLAARDMLADENKEIKADNAALRRKLAELEAERFKWIREAMKLCLSWIFLVHLFCIRFVIDEKKKGE